MVPDHLKYTSTHHWCLIDEGVATIGVTEFALKAIEPVIYVSLPERGADVLKEVPFGAIEGMEEALALHSPFDGEVVAVNSKIVHDPDVLAAGPYDEGWLIRLALDETGALDSLLSAAEYEPLTRRRRR